MLPQEIWSEVPKSDKEEWALEDNVTKAFLVEVIRLAQVATAEGERTVGNNNGQKNVEYHVARSGAFREIAKIIQRIKDDAVGEDDEDEEDSQPA